MLLQGIPGDKYNCQTTYSGLIFKSAFLRFFFTIPPKHYYQDSTTTISHLSKKVKDANTIMPSQS